jgi:hypothetical protein
MALRTGRLWLLGIIVVCFISAMFSLVFVARGGAISSGNLQTAVVKFLGFYLPLLSLVGTFLFKTNQEAISSDTPLETFLAAIFIISLWALTPVLLLSSGLIIEEVLSYIEKLIPLGQSLALMAIGYYFSKSTP